MAKHSHWDNIKRSKGAADKKKAIIGSKMIKLVTNAAKQGGGDPAMNFKLRIVMDTAKSLGVSKDAIDRAIAKATGTGSLEADLETLLYEGYGPGGAAILVECLASNRNKAIAEVKSAFTKNNGTLGSSGSVQWMFARKGVLRIPHAQDENFELAAIDAGADDVAFEGEGYTIMTAPEDLEKVKNALSAETVEYAGFQWIPKDRVPVADDLRTALDGLLEVLDELEDVSEVYTNAT